MDKLKRGVMVATIALLLLVGGSVSVLAPKPLVPIAIGAAYIYLNPGTVMCKVEYEPVHPISRWPSKERDGPLQDWGHFGASIVCGERFMGPMRPGPGYYEGRVAARGTLQPKEISEGRGGLVTAMRAYAESGFLSSSVRIDALLINGRWVTYMR